MGEWSMDRWRCVGLFLMIAGVIPIVFFHAALPVFPLVVATSGYAALFYLIEHRAAYKTYPAGYAVVVLMMAMITWLWLHYPNTLVLGTLAVSMVQGVSLTLLFGRRVNGRYHA